MIEFVCPICESCYSPLLRKAAGQRCGDLSHGQHFPCVGRVIPISEYQAAEWFRLGSRLARTLAYLLAEGRRIHESGSHGGSTCRPRSTCSIAPSAAM